jgi:hypothetical protein
MSGQFTRMVPRGAPWTRPRHAVTDGESVGALLRSHCTGCRWRVTIMPNAGAL